MSQAVRFVLTTAVVASVAVAAAAIVEPFGPADASPTRHDDPRAIVCPVPSGSSFVNGWGAPRPGGRRHEGVDMMAERGAPVVAVQSGTVEFTQSRLGGTAAWLSTDSGNEFYYAHLDRYQGQSRGVTIGEVIGYVGTSGNAWSPHLHFETHFDGRVGNPYEAVAAACVLSRFDQAGAETAGAEAAGDG